MCLVLASVLVSIVSTYQSGVISKECFYQGEKGTFKYELYYN